MTRPVLAVRLLLAGAALTVGGLAVEHLLRRAHRNHHPPIPDEQRLSLSAWERFAATQLPSIYIDHEPEAWMRYDCRERRWVVSLPLGPEGAPVEMPLSARDPLNFQQAAEEALDTAHSAEPLAYREGAPDMPESGDEAFVVSCGSDNVWWLWMPCRDCGGHWLKLPFEDEEARVDARRLAGLYVRNHEGCLNCVAQEIRNANGVPSQHPTVWFDTSTQQWLLWEPMGREGYGVSIEMGLHHYFHDDNVVVAAAEGLLTTVEDSFSG